MGGQWEAVARRSMQEPPPRYTRHRPTTFLVLLVRAHAFARVSVSCSGFELVDDPGHVDDFHGKFPFPASSAVFRLPKKPYDFPPSLRRPGYFRSDRLHSLRLTRSLPQLSFILCLPDRTEKFLSRNPLESHSSSIRYDFSPVLELNRHRHR